MAVFEEPSVRYGVFEVFPDGKRYLLHDSTSRFDCEVYVFNHGDATTALRTRNAHLEITEI